MSGAAPAGAWKWMCSIEPELKRLMTELRAVEPNEKRFCANAVWYAWNGPKRRLQDLVGWYARNKALSSEECYDVAYHTLYDVLPCCRNCACFPLEELA